VKGYKHLSIQERVFLFKELREGASLREIGRKLNRHHTVLSRELERNSFEGLGYLPDTAQYKASIRRTKRTKHPLKCPQIYNYVISKLRKLWSPEQISGRIKVDLPGQSIGKETIYLYIYSKRAKHLKLYKYLRLGRKRRRKMCGRKIQRALIPCRTWITERSESANKRKEGGHWEGDSLMFSKQKAAILINVERCSRYTLGTKMRRKTAEMARKAFIRRFSCVPEELRKSATVDNGSEFVEHLSITQELEMPFYFCHPYSSWEKGSIENTNGLIRQYLPRSTDLSKVSQVQIDKIMKQLNNRPRKCLDFKTPKEVFNNYQSGALQSRM
jgi:IS30 family transposase